MAFCRAIAIYDKSGAPAVPFYFQFVKLGRSRGRAPRAAQARGGKAQLEGSGVELLKGAHAPALVGRAALGPRSGDPLFHADRGHDKNPDKSRS